MQNSLFDFDPDPTPPKALQDPLTPMRALRTRARNAGRGVVDDRIRPTDAIPPGYFRVRSGPVRGDDLVWDCINRRFLRNDSDEWNDPEPADADGIFVARSVKSEIPEGGRRYTFRR